MPPKRGIVKSGNAGNSSKPSPLPSKSDKNEGDGKKEEEEKKPLFPFGSKYPLSLLSERCQKLGWEKPIVDTRRVGNGNSFVVTLTRVNADTRKTESVRLEPHPPYLLPSAVEARHWGATYALYRFSNGLQLNRVLPPGPREYWNQLANEHKNVPEHQKWEYDSDPFAARKAVDERQAKAAKLKEEQESALGSGRKREKPVTNEFTKAPEVRMAASLRDRVEAVVKQAMADLPELSEDTPVIIPESEVASLLQQLAQIGFKVTQARSAIEFLSKPSSFARNLVQSMSLLEACIEYLILHVPECDLPQRMLPDDNSSNSFIVSAHHGNENIKKRWIEDRAVKVAGYPIRAVRQCTARKEQAESWELTLLSMNRMLVGQVLPTHIYLEADDVSEEMCVAADDLEALWCYFADPGELVLPVNTADIQLHCLVPPERPHVTAQCPPPMFISSVTVPAYVRLHLLSVLLNAITSGEVTESGTGFLVEAMGVLDAEWALLEENGPPDISAVLQHLLPPPPTATKSSDGPKTAKPLGVKGQRRGRGGDRDPRTDTEVQRDFEKICKSDKYVQLLTTRQRLPSFASKDQFLSMLDRSRVVVVVGETGCGKTTQLPQFILDSLIASNRGSKASIVVTQPRRVAATSVAARVSAERLDDGSVGYAIRGESKQSKFTKLLFCTTGVVLRRMSMGDALSDITHVIVDEVHERSVDGDFLLLELKELLATHKTLKVILMSATINHDTFVKYFDGAPLLTIPGFAHPVTDVYLEDVMPLIKYRPKPSRFGKKESAEQAERNRQELVSMGLDSETAQAVQIASRADRIDYELVASIVRHITDTAPKKGGILIFLPGVQEITQCMEAVRAVIGGADVFPLHANLSGDDQRRVFVSNPHKWKVVAATNVAETSITIDDVIYVIDGGKVKETSYDPENGLSRLSEIWITRAAGRQRRGRAGRTQPGTCYKLYTRGQESRFGHFPIPEIKRVPLESIALSVKVAKEGEDVKAFLGRAVDPPELTAMDKALAVLEELGATDASGNLTALGRHMATLPVDLRLGKMLILATIFQCLNPILTVAACLSCKPLFLSPMDNREEANQARARLACGNSDLLTDANAYQLCSKEKSASNVRSFCEQNFISTSTVRDVTGMRRDFLAALSDIGFIAFRSDAADPVLNLHSDNENLLKAVIAGALWPRVARVSLPAGAIKYDKVQGGAIRRDNVAKDFKLYELRGGQVFLHPASILFSNAGWRSPFAVFFNKHKTTKVFLRDATEVPIYALLLFGGPVSVNHVAGGLTISTSEGSIKLKAWPRIGILVNQLRRLLDVQLQRSIEEGTTLTADPNDPVVNAMLGLLEYDGLSN